MTRWLMVALLPGVMGFSPFDPAWMASDRLDARRGAPVAGTFWLMGDLASWEALPGSMALRVASGREPSSGAGLRVAFHSLGWPDGTMNDLEGAFIFRRARWRGECAVGQSRFEGHHAPRCSPRLLIAVSPHLVTGGLLTFFPGSVPNMPEFEIEARGGAGPWLLGLSLYDNASEAAIGIEARPGLTVIARYANDVPGLGIVWDARFLEVRAEAEDHPLLGRTARFAIRWMRGRP